MAASQFHATCEGLAAAELRGALAHTTDPVGIWVDGLAALSRDGTRQAAPNHPRGVDTQEHVRLCRVVGGYARPHLPRMVKW